MTAHCADGYGRSVMALPGRATDRSSRGTNLLIRNKKAQLILTAEDIIEELMWDLNLSDVGPRPAPKLPELTAAEQQLLGCFDSQEPLSTEHLAQRSGLQPGELSALLLGMEMSGVVRQLPGNRYICLCKIPDTRPGGATE